MTTGIFSHVVVKALFCAGFLPGLLINPQIGQREQSLRLYLNTAPRVKARHDSKSSLFHSP